MAKSKSLLLKKDPYHCDNCEHFHESGCDCLIEPEIHDFFGCLQYEPSIDITPRYIEESKAYEVLSDYYHHRTQGQHVALREAFNRVPTADVVPVVRCRDCVHCHCLPDYMGFFYCDFDEGRTVSGNGFCDVGERRQDAQLG